MNRKTLLLIALGAVGVIALGLGAYFYFATPRFTGLVADAWDFALRSADLPEGWSLSDQGVVLPHDVARQTLESGAPLDSAASLQGLRQLYYARWAPPELSGYQDLTLQVLLYESADAAAAALQAGGPAEAGWETVQAPTVGDETRVWRYVSDQPGLSQNLFRVDFRYQNGIASVAMFGTAQALPAVDEPLSYARLVLEKMRAAAVPAELRAVRTAGFPDLRALQLSQAEITGVDDPPGGRWQVDGRLLPQWTPTDKMSPKAAELLKQLRRVSGYQIYLIKSLAEAEREASISTGLFQQVSVYTRAENAAQALDAMIGLEQFNEMPEPPVVGDKRRAWGGLLTSTDEAGQRTTLAVHEIDFQVGHYVASIRLQSRPLSASEFETALARNQELAARLAEALAARLAQAEK